MMRAVAGGALTTTNISDHYKTSITPPRDAAKKGSTAEPPSIPLPLSTAARTPPTTTEATNSHSLPTTTEGSKKNFENDDFKNKLYNSFTNLHGGNFAQLHRGLQSMPNPFFLDIFQTFLSEKTDMSNLIVTFYNFANARKNNI
jgi:hypothetical protein